MTPRRAADRKDFDARRGSAHERGYTSAWQRAREGYLRAHPLCAEHERRGEMEAAVVVDHIKAPRLREATESGDAARITAARELFWDRENWQGLCKRCHDSDKQRLEKSGRRVGCAPDGRPLDAGHHWNLKTGGRGG
ncbi:HNH endonuclease [Acidovorax sp. BLS4]|uniref:HNH endonuclease n=1 Tax=Acidovorax sp. BLS4 TaxID=3273430 RepID=UPI002943F8B0|nr:HNH endonuclease [Paracidovorax avenae]WOI43772.1 HNH endonuclease [Paracidovorax avenae]